MAGKAGSLRMPLAAGAAVLAGLILGVAVYLMLPTRSPESNLPRTPVPHPSITPSLPPPPVSPAKPSPKPVAPPGDKTPAPPTVEEPMPNIMTLEPTGEPSPGARQPGHGKTPGGTPKAKPGTDTSDQAIEPAPVRRLELWSAIRQGMISLQLTVHPDPDNPKVMKDVEIKMKREVLVPLIVEIKKGVNAFAASTPGSIGVRVAADTEVDLQGEPEVTLTLPVAGKPSVRFLKIGPHKKPASPEGKGP
jgi:hypothetical protein